MTNTFKNIFKIKAKQVRSPQSRAFLGKFNCAFSISKTAWSSGCCSRIWREAQDLALYWKSGGSSQWLSMPLARSHAQHGAGMPREIFLEKHQQFIENFSLLTCLWFQSCWKGLWHKSESTSKISPASPPPSAGTEANMLLNTLKEKKKTLLKAQMLLKLYKCEIRCSFHVKLPGLRDKVP